MARHARGLICLTMTREMCERLNLPPMVARTARRTAPRSPCPSRPPRASPPASPPPTARAPCRPLSRASQAVRLVRPGHIFPLQRRKAACWCAPATPKPDATWPRWRALPSGVICEMMNEDGTMARMPELADLRQEARHDDRHHRRPDPPASRNESLVTARGPSRAQLTHTATSTAVCSAADRARAHNALVKGRRRRATRCPCACTSRSRRIDLLDGVLRQALVAAAPGAGRHREARRGRGGAAQLRRAGRPPGVPS